MVYSGECLLSTHSFLILCVRLTLIFWVNKFKLKEEIRKSSWPDIIILAKRQRIFDYFRDFTLILQFKPYSLGKIEQETRVMFTAEAEIYLILLPAWSPSILYINSEIIRDLTSGILCKQSHSHGIWQDFHSIPFSQHVAQTAGCTGRQIDSFLLILIHQNILAGNLSCIG